MDNLQENQKDNSENGMPSSSYSDLLKMYHYACFTLNRWVDWLNNINSHFQKCCFHLNTISSGCKPVPLGNCIYSIFMMRSYTFHGCGVAHIGSGFLDKDFWDDFLLIVFNNRIGDNKSAVIEDMINNKFDKFKFVCHKRYGLDSKEVVFGDYQDIRGLIDSYLKSIDMFYSSLICGRKL